MSHAKALPAFLVRRYRGWHATVYAENEARYRRLAEEGQRPRAMVIACCDSRVDVTSLFAAEHGELFIHRNIAALVPAYAIGGGQNGTSAAVEYAVNALEIAHVVVLGHSRCGGVAGCDAMCSGKAAGPEASFVGRWLDLLRDGHQRVEHIEDESARLVALGKQAVLVSLENLMTFPFVRAAVEADRLALHGCWSDIADGVLYGYTPESDTFLPL